MGPNKAIQKKEHVCTCRACGQIFKPGTRPSRMKLHKTKCKYTVVQTYTYGTSISCNTCHDKFMVLNGGDEREKHVCRKYTVVTTYTYGTRISCNTCHDKFMALNGGDEREKHVCTAQELRCKTCQKIFTGPRAKYNLKRHYQACRNITCCQMTIKRRWEKLEHRKNAVCWYWRFAELCE